MIAAVVSVFSLTACSVAPVASSAVPDNSSNQASSEFPAQFYAENSVKTEPAVSSRTDVRYYFPRDGQKAKPQLIQVIDSAQKTLDVAIYSFTDKDICKAILQAKKRGVATKIITDKEQSSSKYQKSVLNQLKSADIPIKIETHAGIMHLKVTIADDKIATTGSFNYTKSAEEENDEVFVVFNDPKTAGDFDREFNRMWNDRKNYASWR